MSEVVLDASALLAVLQREPGHEKVEPILHDAIIGAVNLAEVSAKLNERMSPADAEAAIAGVRVSVADFTARLAQITGELRPRTRSYGLSLGDRACFALALDLGLPIMTADHSWAKIRLGPKVILVRQRRS